MSVTGMSEDDRKNGEEQSRAEMERLAAQLKDLILTLPPRELLGYGIGAKEIAAGIQS